MLTVGPYWSWLDEQPDDGDCDEMPVWSWYNGDLVPAEGLSLHVRAKNHEVLAPTKTKGLLVMQRSLLTDYVLFWYDHTRREITEVQELILKEKHDLPVVKL